MNRSQFARLLETFAPQPYYEAWAETFGLPLAKYPYSVQEYDPSLDKTVPFMVFNFYIPEVDEQKVAAAVIVYKSVHSKTQFRRLIYL